LAILTPYRQQKQLLKNQPMPAGCAECVHSVNEYQGHEANVVVASLVRDNTKGATLQHNYGFLVEPELVNVMLSRARRLLVVVGRFRHFHESGIGFWRVVCETVRREGQVLPAADVVLADAEDA
jgi:superfamily I DNA and/or RNA helicase